MRFSTLVLTAALIALPASGSNAEMPKVPLPDPRPAVADNPPAASAGTDRTVAAPEKPQLSACDIVGVFFSKAEQPEAKAPNGSATACTVEDPVTLDAILALDGARRIAVSGTPLLSCAYASQLAVFLRTIADPLAEGHFGAAIGQVRTGPGFQCRFRNRASGGKVSAHGKGLALDIAGFELTDGRFIGIGSGPAADRAFIDALRKASCGHFTTVLGPGSDSAHETHVHLDTERHGRSDAYRICQ